jgi:hypothetical protein
MANESDCSWISTSYVNNNLLEVILPVIFSVVLVVIVSVLMVSYSETILLSVMSKFGIETAQNYSHNVEIEQRLFSPMDTAFQIEQVEQLQSESSLA